MFESKKYIHIQSHMQCIGRSAWLNISGCFLSLWRCRLEWQSTNSTMRDAFNIHLRKKMCLHQIYRYKSYLASKDNTLTRISGSGTDSAHSKKKLNNSAGTDYVHLAPCVVLFFSVSCSVGADNHQSNAPWQTLHGPSRWGTHLTKMLNMGLLLEKTLWWKYYMFDIHYIKAKYNAPPIWICLNLAGEVRSLQVHGHSMHLRAAGRGLPTA